MKITGKVINVKTEERSLLNKATGAVEKRVIEHVVMMLDDSEIVSARTFDPLTSRPEVGKSFTVQSVKKYENYNGMTSEVLF